MKKYNFVLLLLVFILFCSGSCEHSKEGQRFIVQNNSDNEIVVVWGFYSPVSKERESCFKPTSKFEHRDLMDISIKPHSSKNFERNGGGIGEYVVNHPKDTLYIGILHRIDIDTMSCEEFKQKFPLKKEWKVTLADMQACDWTLVYTPCNPYLACRKKVTNSTVWLR